METIKIESIFDLLAAGDLTRYLTHAPHSFNDILPYEKSISPLFPPETPSFFDVLCASGNEAAIRDYVVLADIKMLKEYLSTKSVIRSPAISATVYSKLWHLFEGRQFHPDIVVRALLADYPVTLIERMLKNVPKEQLPNLFRFPSNDERKNEYLVAKHCVVFIVIIHRTYPEFFRYFGMHVFLPDFELIKILYGFGYKLTQEELEICIRLDYLEVFNIAIVNRYKPTDEDLYLALLCGSKRISERLYKLRRVSLPDHIKAAMTEKVYNVNGINSEYYGFLFQMGLGEEIPIKTCLNVAEFPSQLIEKFANRYLYEQRRRFKFEIMPDKDPENINKVIELGVGLGFNVTIAPKTDGFEELTKFIHS
jgi:hypothetical protein